MGGCLLRHDAFIGRWIYFHKGHLAMVKKVYELNRRPVLVMIMDTDEKPSPLDRMDNIKSVLCKHEIPHIVILIPPIASVNWGRRVGYETNYIVLDDDTESVSSTKISLKRKFGEDWGKDLA